ncbi:MAG TPA: hypothetical protein VNT77_05820 [Allosphingosinicella sp.]|nr:hypothetical protein [Allosphingosinicella sp.]
MPTYYFNVHGGPVQAQDLVGLELPDDEAARSEAHRLAGEITLYEIMNARAPEEEWVEVVREDNKPVIALPLAETIERPPWRIGRGL